VVSTTPRPLYPRGRPATHCTGGWVSPRAGLDVCEKSRTTGIRPPDRPARSQSLYRLSYPVPTYAPNKQTTSHTVHNTHVVPNSPTTSIKFSFITKHIACVCTDGEPFQDAQTDSRSRMHRRRAVPGCTDGQPFQDAQTDSRSRMHRCNCVYCSVLLGSFKPKYA
jgi:hypothetical protein